MRWWSSQGGGGGEPGCWPCRHGYLTPADEALWCRLTKPVPAGGLLSTLLVAEPHDAPRHPAKESSESTHPAPAHSDIQLLPQQAGMASILATAVINSECPTTQPGAVPVQPHGTARGAQSSRPTKACYHWDPSRGEVHRGAQKWGCRSGGKRGRGLPAAAST